jgi:hypothetical protein
MKKQINISNIIIISYKKLIKINFIVYFLYLYKIKSYINLIIKFILLFIVLLSNYSEFTSI